MTLTGDTDRGDGSGPDHASARDPGPDRERWLQHWQASFGQPAQKYLSIEFMRRALAYETQCREHGGLTPATRRVLAAALAD